MRSLLWLASYPKSGNTWMRAFLSNYIWNPDQPVPVNELHRLGIGDAITDAYAKVAKGQLNPADPVQTTALRMPLLKAIDANGADVNFVKTHNQNTMAFGNTLIPPEFTRSAIYIMRDPRDMIISYASHLGLSIDAAIRGMNSKDNATSGDDRNVHQFLGRWSDHVTSWTRTKKFPVLTIRYEDMLQNPEKTFGSVIRRVGMPIDKERLQKAIDFSSFKKLKQQEVEYGFVENSRNQERFFRRGSAGHYEEELSPAQIAEIEKNHEKIMRRHGYLL